jgi:hypothetical protein
MKSFIINYIINLGIFTVGFLGTMRVLHLIFIAR